MWNPAGPMNRRKFYSFCLHCEHPWVEGEGQFEGEAEFCPRPDCSGGPEDTRSWDWVRSLNPGYPAIPKCRETYPLEHARTLR